MQKAVKKAEEKKKGGKEAKDSENEKERERKWVYEDADGNRREMKWK